jgi:hypothetical protein
MSNDPRVRRETATKILSRYWPNHYAIWINGVEDYNQINWLMSQKDKDNILICQTEEDWFYSHDVSSMRRRIRSCEYWTDNSFIITNSLEDWQRSKKIINTIFRPGILDLISYRPYDTSIVNANVDEIYYHTSYLYDHKRFGRRELAETLKEQTSKIAVLKNCEEKIINLSDLDETALFKEKQDAPNVDFWQDYQIFKHCGFVVSLETFNGLPGEKTSNNNFQIFSPTLSEKTYKSIHMLKPAIVFGGHNTRVYLKNLGFDTWDWLVDWRFDQEVNPYLRFSKFLLEIKRLLSLDIEEIKQLLNKNIDALMYNRKRLFYLIENYDKDLF